MAATFYFGEAGGARVLAYGDATSQVGTDFQASLETWDQTPAGESGSVLFRSIEVTFAATAGYSLGITPIVDGVSLPEQTFNAPGTGEFEAQAFFATRGRRCAVSLRTISRTGDLDLHNIQLSHYPIRSTP